MLSTGPGFFHTLRIPLLEGRTFTSQDFAQTAAAQGPLKAVGGSAVKASKSASPRPTIPVLVNRAFAETYLVGQNPLGKHIKQGGSSGASGDITIQKPKSPGWQIIGIAGNTKYSELKRRIHPTIYIPLVGGGGHFELRTAGNPATLIRSVRNAVSLVDSHLPLSDVRTQSQKIDELLVEQRLVARLSSFFGGLAVLLACIGLYGLLSYEVMRRRREVGIRMALGAQRGDILRLILRGGLALTSIGIAIGIAGALALTRFLSSLLYGVKPADPLIFTAVGVLLVIVGALACYIPARRAAEVDPMVALRYE